MQIGTSNTDLQSSTDKSKTKETTSLHLLEEVERNKLRKIITHMSPLKPWQSDVSDDETLSQKSLQSSTNDNENPAKVRISSSFEGYSSVTSFDSRYLNSQHTIEKRHYLLEFMFSEPSIMFYSNVFLMVS